MRGGVRRVPLRQRLEVLRQRTVIGRGVGLRRPGIQLLVGGLRGAGAALEPRPVTGQCRRRPAGQLLVVGRELAQRRCRLVVKVGQLAAVHAHARAGIPVRVAHERLGHCFVAFGFSSIPVAQGGEVSTEFGVISRLAAGDKLLHLERAEDGRCSLSEGVTARQQERQRADRQRTECERGHDEPTFPWARGHTNPVLTLPACL